MEGEKDEGIERWGGKQGSRKKEVWTMTWGISYFCELGSKDNRGW